MTTQSEHRVFNHLLRVVTVLVIIQMDEEKGKTSVSLAANLAATRSYLMEHCPALFLFIQLCYRGQAIPDGLAQQAEIEAVYGRNNYQ